MFYDGARPSVGQPLKEEILTDSKSQARLSHYFLASPILVRMPKKYYISARLGMFLCMSQKEF